MTQGVVKYVNAKEWKDRNGEVVILHSFKLEGDDTYYRTGTDPVPFTEGEAVSFELSGKGKNNVNLKSMRKLEKEEVASSPAIQEVKAAAGARQDSIHYQSSRKVAIDYVIALAQMDLLPLPTKKAEKADKILEYVNHYTLEFLSKLEEYLDGGS